ncbi:MAG TPA: lysophospholipid acyltransferase family protein [Candidatus Limnocylindria bacterium]|nr:lysophospholipid acyltransferase family protein [Candidatus Limnocylindria bacterium]
MTRWRVALFVVGTAMRALFRLRLAGTPPAAGPCIVVANHQGWTDPFAIMALFRARPRLWGFAAKDAVVPWWWKRAAVWLVGGAVVLVDLKVAVDRRAIAQALRVLERGDALLVFPEGRVSRKENDLGEFERGTAYLALRAGAPVVPVWLGGTAELYLGRELVVTVGSPRRPPRVEHPTKETTERFARELHDAVAALSTPYVERPGPKRWRWLTHLL